MRKLEVTGSRRVGAWTLVPVELTTMSPCRSERWNGFYATKTPYALILIGGDGARRALDPEGRDMPLAGLLAEMPALGKLLSKLEPTKS